MAATPVVSAALVVAIWIKNVRRVGMKRMVGKKADGFKYRVEKGAETTGRFILMRFFVTCWSFSGAYRVI